MKAREGIEQGAFATIGVADKRYIDCFVQGSKVNKVLGQKYYE